MNVNGVRDPIEWRKIEPNIKYNPKWYLVPKVLSAIHTKNHVEIFKKNQYNIVLLNELVKEVENHYIRSNHKIEFNNTLPYSEERQLIFRGILPDELFIPVFERKIPDSQLLPTIPIEYDSPDTFVSTVSLLK